MLERLYRFFTSLKLTVVLLAFGLILIFWGTIAQVNLGLYKAQNEFFRSLFIFWRPGGTGLSIPIFPGGYLVGGLLLINLFAAHLRYYKPGVKKIGIAMIHLGIVLLLVGQFLTDMLARESYMHIREGASSNFSESGSRWELAVIDTSDPKEDKVVAIPNGLLAKGGEIAHPEMPFKFQVKAFHANSQLTATNREADGFVLAEGINATGRKIWWRSMPHVTEMNQRDVPSAVLEMKKPGGVSEALFVSGFLGEFVYASDGREYQIVMRPERYYKPFSLHLVDFRFDRYAGTELPKNFSSRVRVLRPATGEDREVTIRMNEPLRYEGETFYQSSYDEADEMGTVLQAVRNPGWLTPYVACIMVAAGMVWQFLSHLMGFAAKRKEKATA